MEIRNVVDEVKNEYPKITQISKKQLKNNIPNKWRKIGLSSLVMSMIVENNVFAVTPPTIAGGVAVPVEVPLYKVALGYASTISILIFVLTGINILITKIKAKKQSENLKDKKWVKIVFRVSILTFILSYLLNIILSYLEGL